MVLHTVQLTNDTLVRKYCFILYIVKIFYSSHLGPVTTIKTHKVRILKPERLLVLDWSDRNDPGKIVFRLKLDDGSLNNCCCLLKGAVYRTTKHQIIQPITSSTPIFVCGSHITIEPTRTLVGVSVWLFGLRNPCPT